MWKQIAPGVCHNWDWLSIDLRWNLASDCFQGMDSLGRGRFNVEGSTVIDLLTQLRSARRQFDLCSCSLLSHSLNGKIGEPLCFDDESPQRRNSSPSCPKGRKCSGSRDIWTEAPPDWRKRPREDRSLTPDGNNGKVRLRSDIQLQHGMLTGARGDASTMI